MKKIIFAIVLWFYFSTSYSQTALHLLRQNIEKINQREMRLDYILYEQWNGNSWNNYLKIIYTYNPNGWVEEFIIYYYENYQWKKSQRQLLSYDAAANISNIIIQQWESGSWLNVYDISYEYRADNQLLSTLIKIWEDTSSAWINQSLENCYYAESLLDYKLKENWNGENWTSQNRSEYAYDAAENLLEILRLTWVVNQWQNENKISYQYNDSGETSQMLTQYYYLEEWINSSLEEYQYNAELQLIVSEIFFWSSDWINNLRREYSYNDFAETSQIIEYSWQDGWQNEMRISYNYLEVAAENQQIATDNMIYPNYFINPSQLSFSLRDFPTGWVEIYNLRGQKIETLPINNSQVNWDIKQPSRKLGSGIYIVVIKNRGEHLHVEKIAVLK
ncbi:MAG: T9SS type A sorting domain-containing protein [Candidatus Cloacimonadales bacterium]